MAKRSSQVDAYIARAQPFAQPILKKIREVFHRASPEVEETIKWGVPSFGYKGMLGGMAGFKQHVRWGLWKAKLLKDPRRILQSDLDSPRGAGKAKAVSDLPAERDMMDLIRQAMKLNEEGVTAPKAPAKRRGRAKLPADLAEALKKNARAATTYKAFSPSHQREYVEWITEAKRPETRERRVAQAVEWMAAGRSRHWKYERK